MSRVWGLQFNQGEVTFDGTARRALWVSQPWLQECVAYQMHVCTYGRNAAHNTRCLDMDSAPPTQAS